MHMRPVRALLLAGALTISVAGVASAHECFIASRSTQGDTAATHSAQWEVLTLHDIFAFILPGVLGQPALSAAQLTWALDAAAAQGVPSQWTIRSDKTIGEGSSNPNLANGKGLDHLADAYGPILIPIFFAAEQQPAT